MGKMIIVAGIRGVGKSSILEKVVKKFPNLRLVNFGEEMVQLWTKKGVKRTHDDLRKLPKPQQYEIKEETWKHLAAQKEDILLDTHVFVEHTGRYVPGLPAEDLKKVKGLCGFFYIDVNNDTLRKRAAKDHTRIREGMDDLELNNYRYSNISAMAYLSTALNIPFYIVYNEDGRLDQAVEIFANHLKEALGEIQ